MKEAQINQQPIELYKILKLEALVGSGGEAKAVIAEGLVKVNGEVELQKRKKIVADDVITFNQESIRVVLKNI
jgi:ribosome-associated protein